MIKRRENNPMYIFEALCSGVCEVCVCVLFVSMCCLLYLCVLHCFVYECI